MPEPHTQFFLQTGCPSCHPTNYCAHCKLDYYLRIALYIVSVSANGVDLSPSPSVSLCVCVSVGLSVSLSVQKVHCGKTSDLIRTPFGMVSGVDQGMGILDGGGDRRREGVVLGVWHPLHPISLNGDL